MVQRSAKTWTARARGREPGGRGPPIAPVLLDAALLAALLAAVPKEALAYIDPGTGGMLVQLLLGGVAGLLVILKLYWHRLRSLFARRKPGRSGPGGASGTEA